MAPLQVLPPDGAIYANRMRLVNLSTQRDMSTVLDTGLLAPECDEDDRSSMASTCQSRVWARATGSNVALGDGHDTKSTGFGLLAGADRAIGESNVRLGVEGGASRINANDSLGGHGYSDLAHVGLYGIAPLGPLQLSATVGYLHVKHHISRPTGVGEAVADPSGNGGSAGLQLAWPLTMGQWRVAPRIGALYQHQTLDGFNEAVVSDRPLAAAYGVDGRKSTFNATQAYGAVSLSRDFVGARMTYTPSFDLGYRYNTRGDIP